MIGLENFNVKVLMDMTHSPISNYIIPGVTSYLIGNPSPKGTIRLFVCDREHQEAVIPHSHRFDFQSYVLQGIVTNRVWTRTDEKDPDADYYAETELNYQGKPGEYKQRHFATSKWRCSDTPYREGQSYGMKADQVHSIFFSRNSKLLIFEGETKKHTSIILEPHVDGVRIPTFKVEDWMFKRY